MLPDDAEIPTITGRVVEIRPRSATTTTSRSTSTTRSFFHPKNAIPVDFEPDNLLYVVPVDDIVAVFRRAPSPDSGIESASELDERDDEE
ncbi:MAG: hypothetical protein CM1200mP2_32870 [Planctomycetaceae bacterium]|nr:MAG: hypothetical protein CM1200mP2_32870 [Planctomycetaceae bacterium]